MKIKKGKAVSGLLSVLLLGCLSVSARAATVTQQLFESTTLVTGSSMSLTDLELTSPGTLVIKMKDLAWPGLLNTLSFTLTDATHALQTFSLGGATSGTWSYEVTAPGTLYAAVFAKPSSTLKAGMYYVDVSYQTTPVPLPAAAWLLISGIAGLAAFRPKQNLSQTCA